MKKIILGLIFIVMVNTSIFSQNVESENADKKFSIQTNPMFLLLDVVDLAVVGFAGEGIMGGVDIEGQYKINDMFNISLSASILYFIWNWDINLKPMFVYRPLKTGLKGFYLGFYPVIGWYFTLPDYHPFFSHDGHFAPNIGFGFNTGYKWIFNNGFTLQLGAGIGKSWFIPLESYNDVLPAITSDFRCILKNFDVCVLDFKIGYSF